MQLVFHYKGTKSTKSRHGEANRVPFSRALRLRVRQSSGRFLVKAPGEWKARRCWLHPQRRRPGRAGSGNRSWSRSAFFGITFVISHGNGCALSANDSARLLASRQNMVYIPEAITLLLFPSLIPSN